MYNLGNLNYLVETNEIPTFPNKPIQNLRQAVLAPLLYRPNIEQTLQKINFRFHRTCSFANLIRVIYANK